MHTLVSHVSESLSAPLTESNVSLEMEHSTEPPLLYPQFSHLTFARQ